MTIKRTALLALTCFVTGTVAAQTEVGKTKQTDTAGIRTLIVFFDGLRPDYITADAMPNLYKFSKQGCYGAQHHSVFPTVTRVNSASYSTGSYPATHGLMGNTVFFPKVKKNGGLDTGDAEDLNKINEATEGHLLTTTSLGEVLQAAGKQMMVFSSGSTGQALLQNHTVSGGAIINPAMILPASSKQAVMDDIGPVQQKANKHAWTTDALMKYGLIPDGPLVSAIWFSDPDGNAHRFGIGSPEAIQSIKVVDNEFGRIVDSLQVRNLTKHFNILISTDHGFVTYVGKQGLSDFLIAEGFKKDKESEDIIVTENAIYVKDHNAETIAKVVAALQGQEWVGGVYTKGAKPGDVKGTVSGTLSLESIHWNHKERAADILIDMKWDDRKNSVGYAGANYSRGVAGHGNMSPYEVHIALMAAGPSFRKAYVDNLPTSNVDIVPTILHIHHITIPGVMDGRVMNELLIEGIETQKAKVETIQTSASYNGGKYNLILQRTILGKYKYVDFDKVIRTTTLKDNQ